jgi:hypothetical protein
LPTSGKLLRLNYKINYFLDESGFAIKEEWKAYNGRSFNQTGFYQLFKSLNGL